MGAAAFVVQIEFGVARQPDHRRLEHGLPREQLRHMRPDDVFEQDERVAARARPPASGAAAPPAPARWPGGLRSPGVGARRNARLRLSERAAERARLVDAERRQDRQDVVSKEGIQRPAPRSPRLAAAHNADIAIGELRQQLVAGERIQRGDEGVRPLPDRRSCSVGVSPAISRDSSPAAAASSSAATRTMKNSSRFEAAIATNLTPLEQRRDGIRRFLQDPFVEGEPRQLAVEEQRAGRPVRSS